MKECKECQIEKNITEYYIRNGKLYKTCKECISIENKKYYQSNKIKIIKNQSRYYELNKDEISEKVRQNNITNKENISKKRKEIYEINKEKIKQKSKEYYEKNRGIINEKRRKRVSISSLEYYYKNKEVILEKTYKYRSCKMRNDSFYKLKHSIRNLIRNAFGRGFTSKSKKTIEILGCSFEDFKLYLESHFDDKMNWDNQGTYWHMDHIIPISSAQTEEDVYRLNHYTNFQPLYWKENLIKSNKY